MPGSEDRIPAVRRRLAGGVATFVLLGGLEGAIALSSAVPAAAAGPAPSCTATVCTVSFAYTGGEQSWTVPAGVTQATVTLDGASGGSGAGASFPPHAAGGAGAEVVATIPVTAGATYQVRVGGAAPGGGNEAGGYNGGGSGDVRGNVPTPSGGGGGASDLRQGNYALADRLLVAGGGGGGGGNGRGTGPGGSGGMAGGAGGASGAGAPAAAGTDDTNGSGAGGGGAGGQGTTTGGAAGVAGTPAPASDPGVPGHAGSLGQGGQDDSGPGAGGDGGGGGGGYFGGGSGGGGGDDLDSNTGAGGGGGGGGSNYVTPTATGVTITDGVHRGNGAVAISYALAVAPAITSADSATFTVTEKGSFAVTVTGVPTPTVTESGALPNGVTLSSTGVLSGTPASGTAGTYPLTITAENGVAPAAVQSFTLVVAKADQSINFTSTPPSKAATPGATYTPTATASSGLPVTFSVDPGSSSVCTGAGTGAVISFTAVGTCVLDADQAGNADYRPAPQASQSINVVEMSSVISVSGPHQVTVGQPASFDVTVTGGDPPSGTVTFALGSKKLGSATLDSAGQATFATTALPVGTQTLTVRYPGDATFAASSTTVTVLVIPVSRPALTTNPSAPAASPMPLASTGFNTSGRLGAAGALLLTGTGLLLASRRRRARTGRHFTP